MAFADAAGKLMITELDINDPAAGLRIVGAQTSKPTRSLRKNSIRTPTACRTTSRSSSHDRYGDIFTLFHKHADKIDRVTFWGVHDGHSWLNDWPVRGRTAYPLLFDRELKPKPAFDAVIQAADVE